MAPLQPDCPADLAALHPLAGAVAPLLELFVDDRRREHCVIAGLDARARLLSFASVTGGPGAVGALLPAVRQVMAPAGVRYAVMAHNHPGGSAQPSAADRAATRHLAALLRLADIALVDHLLFAGRRWHSLARQGLL